MNVISKRKLNCSSVYSKTVLTVAKLRKSFKRFLISNPPGTICKCLFVRQMITVVMKMKDKMTLRILLLNPMVLTRRMYIKFSKMKMNKIQNSKTLDRLNLS